MSFQEYQDSNNTQVILKDKKHSSRRKSLLSRNNSPIKSLDRVKQKHKTSNIKRTRWGNQYGSGYVDGYDLRSSPMGNLNNN